MIPETVLPIPNLSHIVLLSQETVSEKGQHLSHSHNLSRDLLDIVSKQNIHNLWGQCLKVCAQNCHVKLHISVHVHTCWDLVVNLCGADVGISSGGREEMLKTSEPGRKETGKETGGLVKAIEIMNHHVQVEPQSKHLTCKSGKISIFEETAGESENETATLKVST